LPTSHLSTCIVSFLIRQLSWEVKQNLEVPVLSYKHFSITNVCSFYRLKIKSLK